MEGFVRVGFWSVALQAGQLLTPRQCPCPSGSGEWGFLSSKQTLSELLGPSGQPGTADLGRGEVSLGEVEVWEPSDSCRG